MNMLKILNNMRLYTDTDPKTTQDFDQNTQFLRQRMPLIFPVTSDRADL